MFTGTMPHGTTATPTTTGCEIHNRGQLVGRVHVRTAARGRWVADLFAYDGFAWELAGRTTPATLRETRAAVINYMIRIDHHAHVCRD